MTTDRSGSGKAGEAVAVLGEITTRLLDASIPLAPQEATALLDLMPGRRPVWATYPVHRVQSADLGFGVDCDLFTGRGGIARTIGIVNAHAVLTGGHIMQGSAHAMVAIDANTKRQRWSHYVARQGVVEVINKVAADELSRAYLWSEPTPDHLDLRAVGDQVLELVENKPVVDRGSRLKTLSGRLRWAALIREAVVKPQVEVDLLEDGTYLVSLTARSADVEGIIRFCEDLALHAWLLAALNRAFERSMRPMNNLYDELVPALQYLGHLWNPRAHLPTRVHHLWDPIEEGPQLSRAWQSQVARTRDGIALQSISNW
jgi:hypothetical protein